MKIHGSNQTNFNPYKEIMKKQTESKTNMNQKDQLEISNEAKHMQQNKAIVHGREAYIEQIKQAVDAGTYKINVEKTAQKMIDFWSKK